MQEALVEDAAIISAFFPHMSLSAAVWREWLRFFHHQPGSFQFDSVSDRVAQVATEGNPLLDKRVLQGFSPSKNSVARILIATLRKSYFGLYGILLPGLVASSGD